MASKSTSKSSKTHTTTKRVRKPATVKKVTVERVTFESRAKSLLAGLRKAKKPVTKRTLMGSDHDPAASAQLALLEVLGLVEKGREGHEVTYKLVGTLPKAK